MIGDPRLVQSELVALVALRPLERDIAVGRRL